MTSRGVAKVEAALWMVAQLDADTQSRVRRRLALKLDPPPSPPERRQLELRSVAELLASVAPRPGWSFAYVTRSQYDARRPAESASSAALVERYGSWIDVCRHAYHLVSGRPNRL